MHKEQSVSSYEANTSKSKRLFEEAQRVIPGGVSANIKYFYPYPVFMTKGEGSHLYDVDGNEYIDYLLCYGAMIAGHGHPYIMDAVSRQLQENGTTIFGTPHVGEMKLAQKIATHYPAIESVRFTNSGLEATLLAIRMAMALTGKSKVAKFEGHYHGAYNQMLVSINPDISIAGEAKRPNCVADSRDVLQCFMENTIILPFNDLEATASLLEKHRDQICAVILEPIQSGFIPAKESFMKGLRKMTKDLGILLIFDEVKTGFRISIGGAQKVYDIIPDITALGKVLGGGFPIGAIGAKKEFMEIISPIKSADILTPGREALEQSLGLFHSGTYNGHPTTLAAGIATIELLEKDNNMDKLILRTMKFRRELEGLYRSFHIPMQTIGRGSIFNIIFSENEIENYRDIAALDMSFREALDYELLSLGIYSKPLNRYSISLVHTEMDFIKTLNTHEAILLRNKNKSR